MSAGQKVETSGISREEQQLEDLTQQKQRQSKFRKMIRNNGTFLLFCLPGAVWMILFFYIPVFANVVAFKEFHFSSDGFISSLVNSPWVGLKNFEFLFKSNDAWLITRNTLLYNIGFITLNLVISVFFAVVMSMLRNGRLTKVYQTWMLLPYFLSWVIISYFVYAFLSPDKGLVNSWITGMGGKAINWYVDPMYWPYILLFIGTWKGIGYNSILYFATVMGIDPTYFEAAEVDGANKWQQIRHITLPSLVPLMTLMTILAVGRIFSADFGLFYNVPMQSGALYNVTQVFDTYVFNGLKNTGDLGMSSAASLFQSTVGFIVLMISNAIVRRVDSESALF